MPRVQRSPPTTPVSDTDVLPQFSTPTEFDTTKISSRAKRLRPEFSPECQWKSFEEKIMKLLTTWKSEQDAVLTTLTSEIKDLKLQNLEIQKTNVETLKTIEFLSNDYDCIKKSLQKIEKENLEQRIYITNLEKKVADLQRGSRSSAIEIRNVPAREKETIGELTSIVLKTCNIIQPSSKSPELRDIYRLPGKKGSNRPIVAEFQNVPVKNQFLDACRSFNKGLPPAEKLNTSHIGIPGEPKPVYVAEHLPATQRQLFYEARMFAKSNKYKFCWCHNGKILLREREGMEPVIINSSLCLKKLLKTD